jgi:hypothetical protein
MKKRSHQRARTTGNPAKFRRLVSAPLPFSQPAPAAHTEPAPAEPIQAKSHRADGWTYKVRADFLDAFEETLNITKACEKVERSRRSFYELRKRDPEFATAFDEALDQGYLMLETMLLERAMFGTERQILDRQNNIVTLKSHDNRLAMQLLRHRQRRQEMTENRAARAAAQAQIQAQAEAAAAHEAENQWSPSQIAEQSRLMDSIRSRLEDLKAARLAKEAAGG